MILKSVIFTKILQKGDVISMGIKTHYGKKIAICLVLLCLFNGCNSNKDNSHDTMSDAELTKILQQKYGDSAESLKYDYAESITVAKNESIVKKIGFDIQKTQWKNDLKYTKNPICKLYEDSDLQYELDMDIRYDEKNNDIVIEPSGQDMRLFLCDSVKDADSRDDGEWGNLGKYYLVQYVDLNTGETLQKPVITIINVTGEIEEAPQIEFFIDKRGLGGFQWEPVKGAEKYLVFSVEKETSDNGEGRGYLACSEVAITKNTSWTTDDIFKHKSWLTGREDVISLNTEFTTFAQSEDDGDKKAASWKENIYYGVMALSGDESKNSMASNLYSIHDIAPLLVNEEAYNKEKQKMMPKSVSEMPTHCWVVMCNGELEQKLIEYDFDSVEIHGEDFTYVDDDGKKKKGYAHYFYIDYTVKGTALRDTMSVQGFEEDTLQDNLQKVKERQKELESRTGDVNVNITIGDSKLEKEEGIDKNGIDQMKYTVNSAFSEYLAVQMMQHKEKIDISLWDEHYDVNKITDAFLEAKHQTPLILGISDMNISSDGKVLSVSYEDDSGTYEKKQREIQNKVSEIVSSIIKDDMSQLEKEFIINQYLCDNISYDKEALENAKSQNMKSVDKEYKDSFTVYGALLKGKCVCAGYAGAFKLLADEAGLESIVVTGYLDGNLAHAWNKIKISGKWQIVDVTNNDIQFYPNALLNLSNEMAANTLVEDKRYMLDSAIGKYQADSTKQEYYYVNEKYFDLNNIANSIVTELQTTDVVNLRTEYTITDQQFEALMEKVQNKVKGEKLGAGYWLGVIRVEKCKK